MNTLSSATAGCRFRQRNRRFWFAMLAAAIVAPTLCLSSGCTIPSNQGDIDYPTYGGAWQRTRRDSGRVGSVFDPAGARIATLSPRDLPESEHGRNERDTIFSAPGSVPDDVDAPRSVDDPYRQPNGQRPQANGQSGSPNRGTMETDANQIRYQRRAVPHPHH